MNAAETSLSTKDVFFSRVEKLCINRFNQLVSNSEPTISAMSLENDERAIKSYWLSYILIFGPQIKVDLKVHYSTKGVIQLISKIIEKSSQTPVEFVHDCMKEYCNLIGGAVKLLLREANIDCGFSLPLVTSGFDELWFSNSLESGVIDRCWRISWATGSVYVSLAIDLANWSLFSQLSLMEPQIEENAELEIL